ncbi:MAG TPA: CAP domain-containing protein [Candidatus Caccomorpha excrementavium]|nr:CAP domain-containing protein [Candidatus Caccomorpha excrementavium]
MTISGGKGCFIRIWPGFIGGGILQGLPGLLPDTECPDTELPDVEVPDTELPDIELPDVELPDVELPDVELPDTELPDVELPDIELPDAELPGTGNPGADVPDAEAPDSSEDSVQDTSFAAQVVKLVNEERKKAGLSELTVDLKVQSAANVRAKEIVSSFSHTRPDGRQFSTALTEAGVSFRGSGENIAWGQRTPEAVMQAWMNSSGHRANILNARYTSIGVGYYVVNGTPYWTQLFTY